MQIRVQQNFFALFYAPLYVARAHGDFAAEGLEIELATGLMPLERRVGGDAAELLWAGPIRVLRAIALDPATPLRYIAEGVRRDPFAVVGRKPRPDFHVRDLAGLRFAPVSEVPTPWMCLAQDLRDSGIDPLSVHRPPDATMTENVARLRRGEVDAIQVFEPFISDLESGGDGYVWYEAARRGPNAYSGFVGPAPLFVRHPDLQPRIQAAMARALAWVRRAPPAEAAALLAPDFPGAPPALIEASVQRYQRLDIWAEAPQPDPVGLARLARMAQSFGLIAAIPPATNVFA